MSSSDPMEELCNCFDLWVIELVWTAVCVNAKRIDGRLMSCIQSCGRIGRVCNETVDRVGHLVAKYREFVHLERCLVLAINDLVSNQTTCLFQHQLKLLETQTKDTHCDHVCCHAISNEENDILCLTLLWHIPHSPGRLGGLAIVVRKHRGILAWLSEIQPAVGLGCYLHQRWCASILCKEIFKPCEVPSLELWLRNPKEVLRRLA